eukprot:160350_1
MAQDKVSCEATITEMHRTLNISDIMDNIDTYSNKQQLLCDSWIVGDWTFKLQVYPKGNEVGKKGVISIFLQITGGNPKENKFRKVQVTMKYGNNSCSYMKPIQRCETGHGWPDAISHVVAKKHPIIYFIIKLYHYPLFTELPSQSFEQKLEKVHLLSQSHGDITLIVKLNDKNNCVDSPPLKKRKLNDAIDNKVTEIKANSIILRASSNVFDRILRANMREKEEKKIEVCAKSVKDVKDLLYFMTTNKLKSDGNALNIIELAHYYEMDGLFWKCVNKMLNNISIDNFARTINTFDKYEIKKGYSVLVDFAKKNKDELEDADDFDTIPHSFKCAVLNIDESDDD